MQSMVIKEAIEEIFLILAEFYKQPDEEFFQANNSGEIDDRLRELFAIAGYTYTEINQKERFNSFSDMEKEYLRCFSGITKPFAPPIESLYKVWTTDPTAQVTHAGSKGYLLGDSALHIRYLFEQYHIEIPQQYTSMPDHLTLLLEFLAFLAGEGTNEQVDQLLTDHFDWLDDFKKELMKVENSSFYVDITNIVIQAINNENSRLKQLKLS